MGFEIPRDGFSEADFASFQKRLEANVAALDLLLERPEFGVGPSSIGAELELNLIDDHGLPLMKSREVLHDCPDPRVTLEIDRFNLEVNSRPVDLRGRSFSALERELDDLLLLVRRGAAKHGASVVTIGILPTLEPRHLDSSVLTEGHRYRALAAGLRRIRAEAFSIELDGAEPLSFRAEDVTLEGANTSFQMHLRVAPRDFVRTYNAVQLATGVALAAGGNSPTFLGHDLWSETRIALFRQSVDDRLYARTDDWRPARVSFGHGWLRTSPAELFHEVVAMHAPLLPLCGLEDSRAIVENGGVPSLDELRLHNGTVWRWNRPIYDPAGGGHLRIEMRALPAGPTVHDALATSAFMVGLALGLAPMADRLVQRITFGQARRNFYQAAQFGLRAELLWPSDVCPSPHATSATDLVLRLLPTALAGLVDHGVDAAEAAALLGTVEERVRRGATGSEWQRNELRTIGRMRPRAHALMLERYQKHSVTGRPVHTWPLEGA